MSEKKPITLPELIGDKIYLKPATTEHVANTHHWYLASDPSKLHPGNNPILTASEVAEVFKKEMAAEDGQRFVALTIKGNDLVAWIS